MPRLDHPGATRMVRAVMSDPPGMRRMRIVRGRQGGCTDGMKDEGEAGGDAMAGRGSHGLLQCQSGAAERPGGQGDTSTEYRPAQWCAGGWLSSNRSWLANTHRWDAAERPGGLGEYRPNTCLLGGEQVAIYFPNSVLGRQGHQLGRTGGTGYSQCPHGPHGRLWAAANYAGGRDMGHDRLVRWRRRWASSLAWLGLGTVAMGGWTGYSPCPTLQNGVVWCHRTGRGMREGPRPALWCAGGNLFLCFWPMLTRALLGMRGKFYKVPSMFAQGCKGPLREGEC
ncbi:hypothetical protein B0H11DRAFT_47226 [Mycena galericulata]|nr:hypothetical protein B0H11DRAFT_47226 [Mycena galericulata]